MDGIIDLDLRDRFLGGMSHAACTVNIVTTNGPAGHAGVTVSAMASVSADTPRPTLLVCVHHKSPAAQAIIDNGVFCVNVLRDDQSYISDTFAGRFRDDVADKFACTEWTKQVTGAPRVKDPLVAFDCRVLSSERVGTHHVFIGEVEDIFSAGRGSPLIYANRTYGRTSRIDPVASIEAGLINAEGSLRIGCFHTFGPFVLPEVLSTITPQLDVELTLVEGDHRRILESLKSGETDIALMYDFDLGRDIETELLNELYPYVLLAENHPLAAQQSLSLADLVAEPMILLDAPPSADYFQSLFTKNGMSPNIRYRSASFEMVRGMVGRGLGFSILATKPASDISYDGCPLITRPLTDTVDPSRVVLATRKGKRLPKPAQAFASLCRDMFSPET
ncbi:MULTISPECIES: LysR substrate-binding domain-containing protein [unclassified Hwanghaeella]|jgi:flavin reductase (DIM6/NTAB) family NADH-FMN oxidoreductase RutF/DNA-binding transcriptional LysR family regulator|uniref:LysR substrate-binding domain-containing protein n=1 Tax=unclassified Hwanghaeella TaxID=2605944 RepID=UPI003B6756F9|tara:strand:- start:85488 stop:86660 length:1173 start_codon:yes stop_codon:yes gene_type:complete